MKTVPITELRYHDIDFEIFDIFTESWMQRSEFSLYESRQRPFSALFFVSADIEFVFRPKDSAPVSARGGDVVFIPEGSLYSVKVKEKAGKRVDTYTVNFRISDNEKDSLMLSDGISVIASRQDSLTELKLRSLFDIFYRSDGTAGGGGRNLARTKGEFFLLLDLISESASQCIDYYYPIRRGVEAFSAEWNLNEKIEKYASLCAMSETYFYRCFRKWSGVSPIEYRNSLRLSSAESMLRCTDMKIGEIAEAVGFPDAFYFSRLFYERYGASPRNYRKQMQT